MEYESTNIELDANLRIDECAIDYSKQIRYSLAERNEAPIVFRRKRILLRRKWLKTMYYLYVLESSIQKRHYIGITGDIKKRLADHNGKAVTSTKAYIPWRLAYAEEFLDKKSARRREIFLKKTARARSELFANIDSAAIV